MDWLTETQKETYAILLLCSLVDHLRLQLTSLDSQQVRCKLKVPVLHFLHRLRLPTTPNTPTIIINHWS